MTISQRGRASIDFYNVVAEIDPRIYGGFIEHMGRCVYGGIYEPEHAEANEHGFRTDVLELVRALRVPIVRYPGGNFVSGFKWEDSVGPKEDRPVRLDLAWRSIEPNQVGLHEFTEWANAVQSEVMMAVNLGTRGVSEAAELLEYCNHPGGTYLSELRKAHGQSRPFGYKVWCLGNEMDGPWQICNKSASEYGLLAREAGKVMKRLDPSIELVACGSSGIHLPTYPEWDSVVMDCAYEYADYLSVHMYINNDEGDLANYLAKSIRMDEYIRSLTSTCDYIKAKKRSNKTMNLSFDEWNVVPYTWKNNDDVKPWTIGPPLCEGNYSLADALVFGMMIISLLKNSDRVKIACLAQLVNVFGPIMAEKDSRAWKQTIYYPFLHASLYGRGTAISVDCSVPVMNTSEFSNVPYLEAVAVLQEDGGLTIFAVNRSVDTALDLEFELKGFSKMAMRKHTELSYSDSSQYNTLESPGRIEPKDLPDEWDAGRMGNIRLAPMSWNVLRFMPADVVN